jgi:hypothetical protein
VIAWEILTLSVVMPMVDFSMLNRCWMGHGLMRVIDSLQSVGSMRGTFGHLVFTLLQGFLY